MVVAETLAGIALVNSAVKGIRTAIGTAKDISEIANDIDDLFDGTKQVKQKAHPVAGKWSKFLGKTLGDTAEKFSIGAIAQETIEERLAEEQLMKVRRMIDRRFGVGTWDEIIETRKQRIEEHKKKQKILRSKEKEDKEERNQLLTKILEIVLGVVSLILVVGGIFLLINYTRK
jgi:phage-related protein